MSQIDSFCRHIINRQAPSRSQLPLAVVVAVKVDRPLFRVNKRNPFNFCSYQPRICRQSVALWNTQTGRPLGKRVAAKVKRIKTMRTIDTRSIIIVSVDRLHWAHSRYYDLFPANNMRTKYVFTRHFARKFVHSERGWNWTVFHKGSFMNILGRLLWHW